MAGEFLFLLETFQVLKKQYRHSNASMVGVPYLSKAHLVPENSKNQLLTNGFNYYDKVLACFLASSAGNLIGIGCVPAAWVISFYETFASQCCPQFTCGS